MLESATVLDRLIALYPQAKRTTLRAMVASKRVRVNGAPAKSLKQAVVASDTLEVTDAASAPSKPTTLTRGLLLLHADAHLLIVDKPSGLLTATDPSERRPTALKILRDYFQSANSKNQVHLVHRLDRDASGLLVFARSAPALQALKAQFFDHAIIRRYDALVHGIPSPPSARLENLLLEDEFTGMVRVVRDMKKGRLAIMDYVTIQTNAPKKIAHLQCTLQTGRKHQIRAQLKAIGHAILADRIYGPPLPEDAPLEPPGRLALHASHLTLKHPGTRREVSFDSAMPGGFAHLLHH